MKSFMSEHKIEKILGIGEHIEINWADICAF